MAQMPDQRWRDPRTLFRHIRGVHQPFECTGSHCVVHYPSEHHMRSWPMHWRSDKGVVERTCPHGVGHPDPDDAAYWKLRYPAKTIHGCDGCCIDNTEESNAHRASGTTDDRVRDRQDRGVDSVVVVAGTCTCDSRVRTGLRADSCGARLRDVG